MTAQKPSGKTKSRTHDKTGQKQVENGLQKTMDYLDSIIENSLDCIVVTDSEGLITRVNRALLNLLGYTSEELVGEHTLVFAYFNEGTYECTTGEPVEIDKDFFENGKKMIARLFKEDSVANWELYLIRKDRKLVPVEENIVLLYDERGARTASVAIIRDITERKRTENKLKKHHDHLNELVKEKTSELIATNEQLSAREQELRAVNQQLVAHEQQLQAANQQLRASNQQLKESERALKESEERFRAVVETANDAIITANSRGEIISWNKGAKAIFGYEEDEVLRKSVTILVPELKREEHRKYLKRLAATGRVPSSDDTLEAYGLRKDGTEFPLEVSRYSWNIGDEEFHAIIQRDITERRKAEEDLKALNEQLIASEQNLRAVNQQLMAREQELRAINQQLRASNQQLKASEKALQESEKQYRQLVETMNEGLIVRNKDGLIAFINDKLCEMLGYSNDELTGHPVNNFLDEENRKILRKQIAKRTKGEQDAYEITWTRKNGEKITTLVSPRPIFDEKGTFQASFAVITDITELKLAEKEIRESKEFLEDIFKTTADGIMVCDNKGYVTRVNKAIEKMTGFREDELVGKHTVELSPQDEEHKKIAVLVMEELSEKGYLSNVKTDYYRKDGSLCPVEFNATFLRDRKGNPAGAVAAIRDISKRKEMEAQLLQAEKLKSLGELAGGVAHDFNNVLAAVLGRAQMLKRMIDSPGGNHERRKSINELKKGLEIIESAALDGSETVRRIQEFSRKRDDDRYFEKVDLKKVIEGAVEFTKVRWKDAAESKGITYNIRTRLPSLPTIEGSASELREVFTNLINNALDAMPEGGKINIIASFNRNRVVVKVRDSGTGIPKKILDRVFDPFFTTKGLQSTGLGMSVSFGIINRHSGTIIVDSTDGRGTTFTITLPVAEKAEQRQAPQLAIKTSKKASILIIEDEKDVRELLRDLLTIDGHEVQGACDGHEGIELFRHRSFDMVFTDLGMPGMSGWEVAEEIKKIDQKTPVILITGWEVLYKEKEIKKSGIDLVVNKPFQIDQILRIVKEGIRIRERTEESSRDS